MAFFHAEGKRPLESERLTIRVRGSSSTASTFLRSQVGIGSSAHDVEGDDMMMFLMTSDGTGSKAERRSSSVRSVRKRESQASAGQASGASAAAVSSLERTTLSWKKVANSSASVWWKRLHYVAPRQRVDDFVKSAGIGATPVELSVVVARLRLLENEITFVDLILEDLFMGGEAGLSLCSLCVAERAAC